MATNRFETLWIPYAEWPRALGQKRFLIEGLITLVLLACSTYICREVMYYAHQRPGTVLDDPVLRLVGPVSLRWPIFLVLWTSLVAGALSLGRAPRKLLMALQAAAVLIGLRALALYLVPLEPFPTKIPLADPIVVYFSSGVLVTNDLFFSGHTAVMVLLYLTAVDRRLKGVFLAGTVFVALGLLVQHVHYSGDVLAAPFFAYGSWRLIVRLHGRRPIQVAQEQQQQDAPGKY